MGMSRYFRRKAWDEERARELEAHLAHEMDENRERGLSAEEVRRRAYVRLGNPRTIRRARPHPHCPSCRVLARSPCGHD